MKKILTDLLFVLYGLILVSVPVLGVAGGIYGAYQIVETQHIIQWNWYQPTEGPDMGGGWKRGSSGDGLAVLICFGLAIAGLLAGIGLMECIRRLFRKYIFRITDEN